MSAERGTGLLYGRLAEWWPLLSPVEDYADEAVIYGDLLAEDGGEGGTLLELGSGGGHLSSHLTPRFVMTLSDISDEMLSVSRKLNPQCEHVIGDMRTLRLGRTFDRVLIHDAITYMLSEDDLKAAFTTAFEHLRPGGRALFVPDEVKETLERTTAHGGSDAPDGRGLRYLEWTWMPDPDGTEVRVEYCYVLRHADGTTEAVHDPHVGAVFPRATWLRLMREAGFEAEVRAVHVEDESREVVLSEVFMGRKPG